MLCALTLVEIGPLVLKKKIFNLLFRNYLPLEKGVALHLNKLESPSPTMTMTFDKMISHLQQHLKPMPVLLIPSMFWE